MKNFKVLILFTFVLVFAGAANAKNESSCPNDFDSKKFWNDHTTYEGFKPAGSSFAENANKFFKDSTLGIELRNTWEKTLTNGNYSDESTIIHWAQVGAFRFSSGMFLGVAGFDAVGFGVIPLNDDNYEYSTFFKNKNDGFQKGGASIKISPFKGLLIKSGQMESPHLLLGPGDYRTTPRLYELDLVKYTRGDLSLSYIKAKGVSEYVQEGYSDFAINKGHWSERKTDKKPVEVFDITYDNDRYFVTASHGKQEDFSNYTFAETKINFPFSKDLNLRTDFSYRRKASDKKNHESIDHDMVMWAGRIVLDYKHASLRLAYSAVENTQDFSNHIDGTMGSDWKIEGSTLVGCKDGGYYTNGVQGLFSHQGEKAFKIEPEFRFYGFLQGLSVSAYYITGWDMYNGSEWNINQRQHEFGGHVLYKPEFFKGLSFELKHGRNTMKSDGDYPFTQKMERTQFEIKYTALVF